MLTQTEVKLILEQMSGVYQLVARMLYGTGTRLFECAQLRIKDVDLQRREVLVRGGKGGLRNRAIGGNKLSSRRSQ